MTFNQVFLLDHVTIGKFLCLDMFINTRQFLAISWTSELLLHFDQLFNYFLLTYKVEINYAPVINRINYRSENVIYSKSDEIVTDT